LTIITTCEIIISLPQGGKGGIYSSRKDLQNLGLTDLKLGFAYMAELDMVVVFVSID
jgi:hypothetical protein